MKRRLLALALVCPTIALGVAACGAVLGIKDTTVGLFDDASTGEAGPANDGGLDADAGADAAPVTSPCPIDDPAMLVVDGTNGDDSKGDGRTQPYRSITKALALANGSATIRTVCVRGGTSDGGPFTYSEATTGELFPLTIDRSGITLRGESADRVGVAYASIVREPGDPEPFAIVVAKEAHDTTIEGITLTAFAGGGIHNLAPGFTLSDATLTTGGTKVLDLVTTEAAATITRTHFHPLGGTTTTCFGALFPIQVTVTDSSFEGCYYGMNLAFRPTATVTRTTFAKSTWSGINGNAVQHLDTTDCVFDSNVYGEIVEGLDSLTSPLVVTSTNDQFIANGTGIILTCPSAPAASAISITNAHFRLQTAAGLDIACPVGVVTRGTSFEDTQGPAITIHDTASVAALDLGPADAGTPDGGNVFQSTSHPNKVGICLQLAGTLSAPNDGFAHCPPQASATCDTGDVGNGAGTVVSPGCVIAP